MDIRIFYVLAILTIISSGTAYGQNSLISVQTDDSNYDEGDTILVSGTISTIIGDTQVTMQLFKDGNMIEIAQIEVSQDGNYSHTIIAEGPQWKNQGQYIVKVVYGEGNVAELPFLFTPESEVIQTTSNFEVNAGDSGTFDIEYSIRGGTLTNISINPQIFGLVVDINAMDDGTIILDLPREYIDAEKQDGKDDIFIILIDDVQTPYEEPTLYSEFRTLTINFEKDDSEIQIIGTHVIPEFGTVAMIVLTIGIMTSILLTRNRFQIKI
jgi:predicted secreted protein with PEFG-CTERM motif